MNTGETSYEISADDFAAAQRLNFRRCLSTWRSVLIIVTIIVAVAGFILATDGTIDPWGFGLAMFVGALVFLLLPWLLIPRTSRRTWAQRKTWSEVTFSWDADQVWIKTASGDGHYTWDQFYRWAADERMMLLYLDSRLFYLIPARALHAGARETIIGYLTSAGIRPR